MTHRDLVLLLSALPALLVMPAHTQAQPQAPAPMASERASSTDLPPGSVFNPPPENACASPYDQSYAAEPGVYAYWALCEPGDNPALYDYVGLFDLNRGHGAWGSGKIAAVMPGPVLDREPGEEVGDASAFAESQGIPLNTHAGTVAAWVRTDAQGNSPATAVFFGAVKAKSAVSLGASSQGENVCFVGAFVSTDASRVVVKDQCTAAPGTWHRLALVWSDTKLSLFVDGAEKSTAPRSGSLDAAPFFFRLFPGFGGPGKHMALAKVLLSNQAWTTADVQADLKPQVPSPPKGGLLVTAEKMGAIHGDVLGFQDNNANLADPGVVTALQKGLRDAGVRSVRYASGAMGIDADTVDWRGNSSCKAAGTQTPAPRVRSGNGLESYFSAIVKPLSLHAGYTVNYGSNPPDCTAGGDPKVNGADLVRFANVQKQLGIRYWEVGNEQYNGGKGELDLHPGAGDGQEYAKAEVEFDRQMKAQDRSIQIGVPVALGVYAWETRWTYPLLREARFDAAIFHSYPMRDPITDGATLYPDRVASNLHRTRGSLLQLQTMLLSSGHDPSQIWITEWDGDVNGNKWSKQSLGAVMPMFATMQLAEFMTAGVPYATWLEQGSSDGCYLYNFDPNAPTAYAWHNCGGTFLTYTGPLRGEVNVGLKPGDLSPPAHALQLLSTSGFVQDGEHMVRVFPDQRGAPWLAAYGATHGRSFAVILINRDRDQAHRVPVALQGQRAGQRVQQWTYGRQQYDASRTGNWSEPPTHRTEGAWSGTFEALLPPWSVNVFIFGEK